MTLGERLAKVRTDNQLSMTDLIKIFEENFSLKITRSMISRWERGLAEPTNKFLVAYAKYFHLDMNQLLGIADEQQTQKFSPILLRAQKDLSPDQLTLLEGIAQLLLNEPRGKDK